MQVAVVLEHTFFMIVAAPENIAVPVMSHLEFAPNLRKMARQAVKKLKKRTGSETFNGLHLRVEEDAAKFQERVLLPYTPVCSDLARWFTSSPSIELAIQGFSLSFR